MFKKKKKSASRAYRPTPASTASDTPSNTSSDLTSPSDATVTSSKDPNSVTVCKDIEEEDDTVVINPNKPQSRKRGREGREGGDESQNQDGAPDTSVLYSYAASSGADKLARQKTDAFRTNEYEAVETRDARSMHEEKVRLMESGGTNDETGEYRGMNAYSGIIKKSSDSIRANKHTGQHGALRANTFVRTTSRFDYQPDVCKDYKETGFCGFGDTCVFMHDRTDMKKGWELEEEGPFKEPVVTECGHYFCGRCGRDRYKADKACHACGKDVGGVFNEPRKLKRACKKVAGGDWEAFKECKGKKGAGE
ncbi:hypothetical protein TrRE_jg3930 [Triparma retinervis]|uniref:C3H1-type domain-containing protein n=1 Tax=Triparma retinervis TaxID=2557542 RepID=A0A9W7FFX0_9STRA|nr:hypothetical protein TrRE_jg3930 [Triparma retinervis]